MTEHQGVEAAVLDAITRYYVESIDFNGIDVRLLQETLDFKSDVLFEVLIRLVEAGKAAAVFPDRHPNPHIRALEDEPVEDQVEKLRARRNDFCAYPTVDTLRGKIDETKYSTSPFSRRLALGEPQLSFLVFDLSVLEVYRNDPRYEFRNDDIDGMISVHDARAAGTGMREHDQTLLETFGFAYDKDFNRGVAVFLRYLAGLSPEHQQIWNARLLGPGYRMHPDYFRASFLGEFYERVSIFDAFCEELRVLNVMARAMGREPLFKDPFEKKPVGFSFLIRPTQKEADDFIQILDKMISENVNRKFFGTDIRFEDETVRPDGKIVVNQKGTLSALEEWVRSKFRVDDPKEIDAMFKTLRKIREMRSKPAHKLNDNIFDMKLFHEQRALIIEAYRAMRMLRLLFANHPNCGKVEVMKPVREGKIWTY